LKEEPLLPKPPPGLDRFLDLELPERFEFQFIGPQGDWWGEAQMLASQFARQPDGSYCGSAGGSPVWFRCVQRHDGYFIHVDGGGRLFAYRLLPLPP